MKNFVRRGIKQVETFVKEFAQIIGLIYSVALGHQKRIKLGARSACSLLASLMTAGVIALLVRGSMIWSGCLYFIASVEKRLAIAWATQSGNWYNWLTGARYTLFAEMKEDLIASDRFAKFLNDLAAVGGIMKLVQVLLLIACIATMLFLLYVLFKCLVHFAKSTMMLIKRARNRKIISFKKASRKHQQCRKKVSNS